MLPQINPPATGYAGFASARALARNSPLPFDDSRDGFALGEGAAALVLELETHAAQRGAEYNVVLSGVGSSSDAHHPTAPSPGGEGAALSMQRALADARVRSFFFVV